MAPCFFRPHSGVMLFPASQGFLSSQALGRLRGRFIAEGCQQGLKGRRHVRDRSAPRKSHLPYFGASISMWIHLGREAQKLSIRPVDVRSSKGTGQRSAGRTR